MGFGALLAVADRQNVDHLGEPIGYTPADGPTTTPRGIFDAVYQPIDGNQEPVGGSHPAVFFLLADLPSDPYDDPPIIELGTEFEVAVRGTYSVGEVHRDGAGGVFLVLQKV